MEILGSGLWGRVARGDGKQWRERRASGEREVTAKKSPLSEREGEKTASPLSEDNRRQTARGKRPERVDLR
ncbi:hypothetical protein PIB30_061316 [Stylosanthes scabra]|uniref:Uncharacterized protein n=1 Tax=Stylosanthes scabra TaxID=79078 RepID=A0ABU6SKU5_9FABA|nr:hypothetical protein [Stylosanthes scabra]